LLGILSAVSSVLLCVPSVWLRRGGRDSLYGWPMQHLALVQVALGVACCAAQLHGQLFTPDPRGLAAMALALGLGAATLILTSAFAYRLRMVAAPAVALVGAASGAAMISILLTLDVRPLPAPLAIAVGAWGLLACLGGVRLARLGTAPSLALYRDPLSV